MTLMTTGTVMFSVAWAVDEQGQALVPPTAANATSMFKYVQVHKLPLRGLELFT